VTAAAVDIVVGGVVVAAAAAAAAAAVAKMNRSVARPRMVSCKLLTAKVVLRIKQICGVLLAVAKLPQRF
jgi:hypothetical protein